MGRPDIDSFEAVMIRENRDKGFIVGFDFTLDAEKEINRSETRGGRHIIARRVKDPTRRRASSSTHTAVSG